MKIFILCVNSFFYFIAELDSKASNLSLLSEKYKKDAHFLNISSAYTKLAAAATVVFVVFLYFWIL